MSKRAKKPQWGIDFNMVIYNPSDEAKAPTLEDIAYISTQFENAVDKRGLTCGGGTHQTRIDIITCSNCFKNEALDDCDYCLDCLDKIAKSHGYEPQPPFIGQNLR